MKTGVPHGFSAEDAKKYGLKEAVVLFRLNLKLNILISDGVDVEEHHGIIWARLPIEELQKDMPYFSKPLLRRCLARLCEAGVVRKGNFNKSAMDTTSWLAVVPRNDLI